ncbi:head morphogenesis [Proteus phage vB_PmiP_RS51pmB]|nr:head morphogenesis [Proteus phage vB_PmiP_RS51pmB]
MELRELIEKLNEGKVTRDRKAQPIKPAKAAEVWYRKQLLAVVAQLKEAAISAFSDNKFTDEITPEEQIILNRKLSSATDKMRAINIDQLAMQISRSFVSRGFRINEKRASEEYQSIFGVDVARLAAGDTIRQQVEVSLVENVNLIKSIQNDFINDIGKHVRDRLYAGERSTGMIQLIHERGDVTVNRAKFIARDQTAKLNADLNQARNADLGIDLYIWGGTGDARERDSHSVMNGMLCKYSDPTVYSDDMGKTWKKRKSIGGVELHPGKDYQCRCVSRPYIKWD